MPRDLGIQLYSVRDELADQPVETLRRLADIGYRAVEPHAGPVLKDPAGLRSIVDEHGLTVWSVHGPALGDRRDDVFAGARVLGAETVVIPFIRQERFASEEAIAELADDLRQTAARAADQGLRLAYHNHGFELAPVAGRTALEVLADHVGDALSLQVDLWWVAVGGADVPALLSRLGDRVRSLHVKDGPIDAEAPNTAVGEGAVAIAAALAAAPQDAQWMVELEGEVADRFELLRRSFEFLAAYESTEAVA